MKHKKPIVVLIGPQGSGKGTQGKQLAERLKVAYLETGKLLRDEIEAGSTTGRYIASVIDHGEMLPDAYTSEFMAKKISDAIAYSGGVVIDGFPRSDVQADALDAVARPTHVVLIDITDEEAVYRLSARRQCPKDGRIYNMVTNPPLHDELCDDDGEPLIQRADDMPDAIKKRLTLYHENTEPILIRYDKADVLHRVDGMPDIENVRMAVNNIFK